MDELSALKSLGIELPSPAYVVGVILFSVIGMAAFYRGRKRQRQATLWLGVALMFYPYVVWQTGWLYAIGVALRAALWFTRA